jgi:hypothetical protein
MESVNRNKDVALYNEQSRMMASLTSEHTAMKIQVESYENTMAEMQEKSSYANISLFLNSDKLLTRRQR